MTGLDAYKHVVVRCLRIWHIGPPTSAPLKSQ
jgi:hypothetical protein